MVGQSQDLIVGEVVGQAESVQQDEVDVFGALLRILEGVVYQGADGSVGERFQ